MTQAQFQEPQEPTIEPADTEVTNLEAPEATEDVESPEGTQDED